MRLIVPANLGDELAGDLGRVSTGVEIKRLGADRLRLRFYFGSRVEAERARPRVTRAVARWGIDTAGCDLDVEEIADEGWVERYQAGLRPLALGASFVVIPGKDSGGFVERERIRLSPGRAFGTGEHPTTRLCAAALETRVRPGSRWIDVGTGSGILSVVAAKRGAAEVVAIDIDPDAVAVARETIRANEVVDRVSVEGGTLDGSRGLFDGAVVNILERYFIEEGPAIAACVRDGGVLLASGLERDDVEAVGDALTSAGFQGVSEAFDEDWALLVFERVAGARA